ncbi:MAG: phosphoribosylglycinamide formyltransferase [Fibromonadaceae bacterium]|nr:phosphoribosylglycinamide formyltransferase [Fibromonadaceae bacterium]
MCLFPKLKFSVISTGRGSNFDAIMQHVASGELNAECASLITFKNCKATEVAGKYGVPIRFIEGDNLFEILQSENPNLIVLSGYMRKIPENILERFKNKIINIHPALLPSFGGKGCYGIHVHEKVIEAGVKITGVTVHFVNKDYDAGKIIAQIAVPVLPSDTPEILAERVLKEEHNIYWQVIRDLAEKCKC